MSFPNYVEVETSRYCNRQCAWCPNDPLRNRKLQEFLPWAYLERVIQSLRKVQYRGWFAFHNYNEPLANPRIMEELEFVHEALPQAKTTIYTNGDRLTADLFAALVALGLSQMRVTLYPKNRIGWAGSHDVLWSWLERRPFLSSKKWDEVTARQGPSLVHHGGPEVILISPDIERYYDRGGTVPWLSLEMRTKPCFLTSHSLSVDYMGKIKMCCNVVTGNSLHGEYFLGDVRDDDILEVWNSSKFDAIREHHRRSDWSMTRICKTCRQEIQPVSHEA